MSARDPLHELEDALSFKISPDFGARVRQQVAAQPPQSQRFGVRGLALAAAVLLAIGIGGVLTFRGPDEWRARALARADSSRAEARDLHAEARADSSLSEWRARALARADSSQAEARDLHPEAVTTRTPFATLVPDDQRRALDYLLAAMREGRATVPPTMVDEELNDRGQLVLRALAIDPMKLEPLAGTPGETTKDPVKDPIK